LIADHFGTEALAGAAGEQAVAGIKFEEEGGGSVVLAVGGGEGDFTEEGFEVPLVVVAKAQGEVVEEPGVRGKGAGTPEVFEGFDDAISEHGGPEAVGEDAGGEGILGADDPTGHIEAVIGIFGATQEVGDGGGDEFVEGGAIPANKEAGFAAGVIAAFLHDGNVEAGDGFVLVFEGIEFLPNGVASWGGDKLREGGIVGEGEAEAAEDTVLVLAIADRSMVDGHFKLQNSLNDLV